MRLGNHSVAVMMNDTDVNITKNNNGSKSPAAGVLLVVVKRTDDYMNNLRTYRAGKGYSLQELGDMCGRSKAQMHELEKDGANPTLKTAYAISKVLGVEVTDIWPNTVEIIEETITVRRIRQ